MAVKSLELENPCETRKWYRHFPSESFQRENRTTFSEAPFIPEIFQWNEPKTCVPFTSQPEFSEFLGKWKTPIMYISQINTQINEADPEIAMDNGLFYFF